MASTTWSEADDSSAFDPRQSWASQETSVQAQTPAHALRLADALRRLRIYGLAAAELGEAEADVEACLRDLERALRARAAPRAAIASTYMLVPAGSNRWRVAAPGARVRTIATRSTGLEPLHVAVARPGVSIPWALITSSRGGGKAVGESVRRAIVRIGQTCPELARALHDGITVTRQGDVCYEGPPIET